MRPLNNDYSIIISDVGPYTVFDSVKMLQCTNKMNGTVLSENTESKQGSKTIKIDAVDKNGCVMPS